jgi:hypothetical protein
MTTLPFITCGLGLGVAIGFESAYAYIDKRWDTPADKDVWLICMWSTVIAVLICCGAMPLTPSGLFPFVPFLVVFVLHVYISCGGGSFGCRRNMIPRYRPPSTPPTPPVNPVGRDMQNVSKPKSNNQQKG